MAENADSSQKQIAFNFNPEETILHLNRKVDAKKRIAKTDLNDSRMMCGDHAVWFTAEIQGEDSTVAEEKPRITRCWYDDCIPQPFQDLTAARYDRG